SHEEKDTKAALAAQQWDCAHGLHAFPLHDIEGDREPLTQLLPRRRDEPLPRFLRPAASGPRRGQLLYLGRARRGVPCGQHVGPELVALDREFDPKAVGRQDVPQALSQGCEELVSVQVPRYRPVDFEERRDRKSTRLNSSHVAISYAVFCLKK